MDLKKYISFICIVFCLFSQNGCQDAGGNDDSGSNSSSSSSSASSTVVNGFIQVDVYVNWEGGTAKEQMGSSCTIPLTAASGTVKTCTIMIPELKLYYSDLTFKVSVPDSKTCTKVAFIPYYYQKSANAAFKPDGTTGVDCSLTMAKNSASCYGGAAPDMLSTLGVSFPKFAGVYFLPSNEFSKSYVLKSSNTRKSTATDLVAADTNVGSANNLPNRAIASLVSSNMAGGDSVDYLTNSMVDYTFDCENKWYDSLYKIKIIIADEDDSTGGAINDTVYDWSAGD